MEEKKSALLTKTENVVIFVSGKKFILWLGGALFVYNQPGYGFWDAVFWLYYVGRFVAQHFAALTPMAG